MNKLFAPMLLFALMFQMSQAGAFTHDTSLIKWHAFSQETFELAKKEGRPVFMVIAAEWCHMCKLYEENTLETAEVSEILNENFVNIFVDFDREQEISWQYLVGGTPTTVIFSPEGEKIIAAPGYILKEDLLSSLERGLPHFKAGHVDEAAASFNVFIYKKLNFSAITFPNITAVPLAGAEASYIAKSKPLFRWLGLIALFLTLGIAYKFFKSN